MLQTRLQFTSTAKKARSCTITVNTCDVCLCLLWHQEWVQAGQALGLLPDPWVTRHLRFESAGLRYTIPADMQPGLPQTLNTKITLRSKVAPGICNLLIWSIFRTGPQSESVCFTCLIFAHTERTSSASFRVQGSDALDAMLAYMPILYSSNF